jgi:predicted RNase H-like HicB family nuclease
LLNRLLRVAFQLHIEKLPEGVYLATSDDLQGLVAQGKTLQETLEIARDVTHQLIEAKKQRNQIDNLKDIEDDFYYPLVV